jgi:3'-phosphoadenosine 5'-phosphosulfate sulfotransferase (PAPS reductase)/FAD synthetase
MNNIISLSGGKDSTAMLLMMLEHNEPIHSVVFFDTGWEFPEMYEHIDKLEKYIYMKIWRLHPRRPFEYWMFYRPIKSKKDRPEIGIKKGDVHRIGNGWPSPSRRWCTRQKVETIKYYVKSKQEPVMCIGYALDEKKRIKDNSKYPKRYPLIEYGITEDAALKYCLEHGFSWGGLYEIFNRVSCYCCPLQRISELRKLRKYFPKLWNKMLEMDSARPEHNKGFKDYKTVHDFEKRFSDNDKQQMFFCDTAAYAPGASTR